MMEFHLCIVFSFFSAHTARLITGAQLSQNYDERVERNQIIIGRLHRTILFDDLDIYIF